MQTPLKRLAGRIRSTDAARAGAWRLPLAPAHPDGRRAALPLRAPNPHQIPHPETSPMQPTMTSLAGWSMTAQMHGPARPEAMLLVPRMVSGQPGFAGTRFPGIAAKHNSWHGLLSSSNPDASRTTLASPGSLVTGGASVPVTGGGGWSCARLHRQSGRANDPRNPVARNHADQTGYWLAGPEIRRFKSVRPFASNAETLAVQPTVLDFGASKNMKENSRTILWVTSAASLSPSLSRDKLRALRSSSPARLLAGSSLAISSTKTNWNPRSNAASLAAVAAHSSHICNDSELTLAGVLMIGGDGCGNTRRHRQSYTQFRFVLPDLSVGLAGRFIPLADVSLTDREASSWITTHSSAFRSSVSMASEKSRSRGQPAPSLSSSLPMKPQERAQTPIPAEWFDRTLPAQWRVSTRTLPPEETIHAH